MDLFIHLLNMLRINPCLELSQKDPVEFQIIDNYQVGNSTIIGGILRKGTVSVDQKLRIGPDREGLFRYEQYIYRYRYTYIYIYIFILEKSRSRASRVFGTQ